MKKYSFFFLFLPSWINQIEKKRRRRRREKFLAHEIHVDHTQSRQIFSTVVGFDSANAAIVKSSYNRTIKLTITSRFEREKKGTEFLSFSSVELYWQMHKRHTQVCWSVDTWQQISSSTWNRFDFLLYAFYSVEDKSSPIIFSIASLDFCVFYLLCFQPFSWRFRSITCLHSCYIHSISSFTVWLGYFINY